MAQKRAGPGVKKPAARRSGAKPLGAKKRGPSKPSGRSTAARTAAVQPAARRSALAVAALVFAVVAVPVITALVVMRSPRWYPIFDWAQIEMRVRDVGTRHSPLIGLPGRLDGLGVIGSHPGPMGFYALAPIYRLLGSSSWALLASNAALNVAAVGTAVWIAVRRGGWPLALGVTAMLAVLVHAYGAQRLTVPWLPWSSMLWWFVFLLAAWSVLCGDFPLLPVMVGPGVSCVQAHISYLGLVAGIGMATTVWVLVEARRRRRDDGVPPQDLARWARWSGALLVLLWLPVLIDEVINKPGNLSVLWDHFSHPGIKAVGMSQALSAWWAHLDVTTLLTGHQRLDGAPWPGALLLIAWVAAVAASWRWRHRALLALHTVVASALLLGLLSISRILGRLLDYLVLWLWGTTVLVVIAVGYTAAVGATRYWSGRGHEQGRTSPMMLAARIATTACVAVALLAASASTIDATRAHVPHPGVSRSLSAMMPTVLRKLPRDGRYYISWEDSFADVGAGFSLLLELERAGLTAGMDPTNSVMARPHGVLAQSQATAVVAYVTGKDVIASLKATPGAVELAHYDSPREDKLELSRLHDEVARALKARRNAKLFALLDTNLFRLATHPQVPDDLRPILERMLNLSVPASVIVIPLR